jgi:hypothetical protein
MDDLQILDVWGAGRADLAARPALMLAAAHPSLAFPELPVGRYNELLLRDRQATFGDTLEGDVACPGCGERLEVAVPLRSLLAPPSRVHLSGPASPPVRTGEFNESAAEPLLSGAEAHESPTRSNSSAEVIHSPGEWKFSSPQADRMASGLPPGIGWGLPTQPSGDAGRKVAFGAVEPGHADGAVCVGDVRVRFRVPVQEDLLAASEAGDPGAAARVLLARCVVDACRGDEPVAVDDLQAEVVDVLDAALAELDPYADLRLATTCATCGHAFEVAVEPGGLYWAELAEHARRLLVDVHRLACAYGWTEREILGIDPARREAYLELVG